MNRRSLLASAILLLAPGVVLAQPGPHPGPRPEPGPHPGPKPPPHPKPAPPKPAPHPGPGPHPEPGPHPGPRPHPGPGPRPRPPVPPGPYRPGVRPPSYRPIHGPAWRYPHGYRYRRWSVGVVLPGLFLTSAWFYRDYWRLGLQGPPYGYEWIRYGPDLLLVEVRTGRIVDVIYGAFY